MCIHAYEGKKGFPVLNTEYGYVDVLYIKPRVLTHYVQRQPCIMIIGVPQRAQFLHP